MKIARKFVAAAAACLFLQTAVQAAPVQLAFWPPKLQLVSEDTDVGGFRFSIYGRNPNMTGFDLGIANESTENFTGISFGFISSVGGEMRGLQWQFGGANATGGMRGWQSGGLCRTAEASVGIQTALVAWNQSDFKGAQLSMIFNEVQQTMTGFQAGIVNHADTMNGFQLGFANFAGSIKGIQIGIWNQIYSKDKHSILPLVNWSF
jgi:hypothetical protein